MIVRTDAASNSPRIESGLMGAPNFAEGLTVFESAQENKLHITMCSILLTKLIETNRSSATFEIQLTTVFHIKVLQKICVLSQNISMAIICRDKHNVIPPKYYYKLLENVVL
jgi:hypothetical protein